MLGLLPPPLRGALALVLCAGNTLFWSAPLLLVAAVKLAVPARGVRARLSAALTALAEAWVDVNGWIFGLTRGAVVEVRGPTEALSRTRSYLMTANHQSWTDILVLQGVFRHRVPFLKFFLKQQLLWMPVLGLVWWALDFPYMRRYSSRVLQQRPELRGKDLETTRRACEKFRTSAVTVITFPEGTRFTAAKQLAQGSPYRHLLLPRAGGLAFVLSCLGEHLSAVVDATLVYPDSRVRPSFWNLLCGRISRVVVEVAVLPLPGPVAGRDYLGDEAYRRQAQDWVNRLWAAKDERIARILAEAADRRAADLTSPPGGATLGA
ncbi:MAG: acyltransferase [Deferrisomatales bacterium]